MSQANDYAKLSHGGALFVLLDEADGFDRVVAEVFSDGERCYVADLGWNQPAHAGHPFHVANPDALLPLDALPLAHLHAAADRWTASDPKKHAPRDKARVAVIRAMEIDEGRLSP